MSAATKGLLKVIKALTAKEERDAIAAALKHLGNELSQRYQVFPVELRIAKPSRPNSALKRTVAVLIIDLEKKHTTEVVVDTQGTLVEKTDLTGFQPAFLAEEIRQAREIAEADKRVASAISVRGTFASGFGPHAYGDPGARMVGLRYATVDRRLGIRLLGEAVVDLSERKLVTFEELRKETN
jgi:hypothetical protein